MDNTSTIWSCMELVKNFCDDRDWAQFHNPKDLAIGISTEAGELLEHFRFKSEAECQDLMSDLKRREEIEEELADVFYFVLRFAQRNDIDLGAALANKVALDGKKYPVEKAKGQNKKYSEF